MPPASLASIRAAVAALSLPLWLGCALGAGCGSPAGCAGEDSTGWLAAERLFRGDKVWLGSDGAGSIDLGGGRVLWLFADTFVSRDASGSRSLAPFARNTIALETGYDPTSADRLFYYRRDGSGTPSAFFPAPDGDHWYWPGHGARVGDRLLVLLTRMRPRGSGDAFDFMDDGPEARIISNPDDAPDSWKIDSIALPTNPWGAFLSAGAVVVKDGYLYVFACAVDAQDHPIYLARWPIAALAGGQFADPEWQTGGGDWTVQSRLAGAPPALFSPGHTELSVHFDAATSQYVELQATGFPGDITMRTAPALEGPWSPQVVVYNPPEESCPGDFAYAAKAHPELQVPAPGGVVAVTYATSSFDFWTQQADTKLYYPRFVLLDVASAHVLP
jgi:hypothetical protein